MQYTINQLYNLLHDKVNTIHDIFNRFFGEEHVDLQQSFPEEMMKKSIKVTLMSYDIDTSDDTEFDIPYEVSDSLIMRLKDLYATKRCIIYVWWPSVTITNENNKSIVIQDLYAKIEITLDGTIPYENHGFLLNRATYNKEQFCSNYMHSHICNIPKTDFTQFQNPCLGTGPIIGTIGTLKNEYDETIWMLFCQELSMYVTVESLTGRPYNYLEEVGSIKPAAYNMEFNLSCKDIPSRFHDCFTSDQWRSFIKYYLENGHLSFTYKNGKFQCGMSYYEYCIDISNSFISFYNECLVDKTEHCSLSRLKGIGFIHQVLVKNGKFYDNTPGIIYGLGEYRYKFVLRFKGKDIYTTITEDRNDDATLTIILDENITMHILRSILRTINFRYKNEYYNTTRGTEEATTARQGVLYL